jgi:hypothetical protein
MIQHGGHGSDGSIPALVMRTGQIMPVSPRDARRDLNTQHVLDLTDWRMGLPAPSGPAPSVTSIPAPASPMTSSIAQTVTAKAPTPIQSAPTTPIPSTGSGGHAWHRQHRGGAHHMIREIQRLHPKASLHGAEDVELGEWNGRPIAKFEIAASPPVNGARAAAESLQRAAHVLRRAGLGTMPPELVAGPLAALMRGGAVELHFQNGAVVRAAL